MTVIERFRTSVFVLALALAAAMGTVPVAHAALFGALRLATPAGAHVPEVAAPQLLDGMPVPDPVLITGASGTFGGEDDFPVDDPGAVDVTPPDGRDVRHRPPDSDRRVSAKPFLIPFETGPPAA